MASSLLARRLLDASRARVARDGVRIVSRAASSVSAPCWSCGEPSTSATAETLEGDFFCASCGVIQPPSGADHFKTLGVEQKFALEASALEEAMKRRQKLLHPDKFSTKSEAERQYSADQASAVNDAYGTLRDPLKRAKYILDARGWGVTERDGRDTPVDPELLMEVMEAREAILDADGDTDALRELLREHSSRVKKCEEEAREALDAEPMDGERAKNIVVEMTYFVRIVEEIKAKM